MTIWSEIFISIGFDTQFTYSYIDYQFVAAVPWGFPVNLTRPTTEVLKHDMKLKLSEISLRAVSCVAIYYYLAITRAWGMDLFRCISGE